MKYLLSLFICFNVMAETVTTPKFHYGNKVKYKKEVNSTEIEFYNLRNKVGTIVNYKETKDCFGYVVNYEENQIQNRIICEDELHIVKPKFHK
jgi:hypothetical protein